MSDPPGEGSSSPAPSTSKGNGLSGGFYDSFHNNTPARPSFLEDSTKKLDEILAMGSKEQDFTSNVTLYSTPANSTSVSMTSTFGSVKRKRPAEVVSKPSFKVSEFIAPPPHLPKFGTSLTKAKFDFTSSSRSMFYSGRTKFGGSSSVREESAKRIKISPVSNSPRTNLTRVSAKPYTNENKRTLTSKTAENILKTLNKICSPAKQPEKESFHSEFTSSFSSMSKRLREKRKAGMSSLPAPPIARLNQVKSVCNSAKVNGDTIVQETETKTSAMETVQTLQAGVVKTSETEAGRTSGTKISETSQKGTVQGTWNTITPENEVNEIAASKSTESDKVQQNGGIQSAVVNKNSFKMKRQRTGAHYTASEKSEEPVNSMPEVTAIQPMVMSALPKFDMSVKPSSVPIFTPIMKLPKPVNPSKSIAENNDGKFEFSTPEVVSNKNIDSPSLDMKYSFISPVLIKNPGTPRGTKEVSDHLKESLTKNTSIDPVKEIRSNNQLESICKEKNPVQQPPVTKQVKDTKEPVAIGFKFAKPEEGSWKCPTCMITNKPDCLKCAACTEPKPGSKEKAGAMQSSFSFGQTAITTSKSEFSFGKTSLAASTFSFASTNVAASTGFTFSKPFSTICSSGFSFGKTSDVTSSISSEAKVQPTRTESISTTFGQQTDNITKSEVTLGSSFGTSTFGTPVAEIPEKTSNTESKPNPFEKFKPATGSWNCPTCMIANASDCQKCVACTEPKPGVSKDTESVPVLPAGSSKSEYKFGGTANSISSNLSFGASTHNTATGGFKFGAPSGDGDSSAFSFGKSSDTASTSNPFDKFKPPTGSWDCPTCMIVNVADSLKCVSCTEPKPGAKSDPPAKDAEQFVSKPEFTFGSSSSNSFTFVAVSKSASAEGSSFKNVAAGDNPFLKMKQPETGSWDCPTCMIKNKPECVKCAACTEPKPGSKELVMTSSTSTDHPAESGFSFGKPSNESNGSSGFSFAPPPVSSVSSTGSSGFSYVSVRSMPSIPSTGFAASSEFSFGKASTNSAGFSFGNTGSSNSTSFSFGSTGSQKESEVKVTTNIFGNQGDDKKILNGPTTDIESAPSGFNFGAVNKNENPMLTCSSSPSTNVFSSIPSFDSSKFNGIPAPPVNSTPQFNFQSNAAPSFLFNSNDTKVSEPAKFNFNPGTMSTPNFNFGAATSASAIFGNPTPSGQFNFANNNNVADSKNETSKANMFSTPSAGTNLFSMGGGSNTPQRNSVTERRKVKRAHRKLPGRK